MESKQLIILFVQCFIIFSGCGIFERTAAQYVEVRTQQGIVQGKQVTALYTNKTIYKFVGIPYAKPPVGPLRFKSPQPPASWTGVRPALTPGSICVQTWLFQVFGSEDCLYINVYTPQLPKKYKPLKPVMVWIHGGLFRLGDGYSSYGPDLLVSKDVVLVSLNYRLGPMGFLSLESNILSGNYGLKDQVQALRWVQQNIASFGGDPNKVTIFGESAGGASVHYLTLSQLSKGLFHKVIAQSGTAIAPWAFNPKPKETAIRLVQYLGYNATDENELYNILMNASASVLFKGSEAMFLNDVENPNTYNPGLAFVPCKEVKGKGEKFITQSPRKILVEGKFIKVPLMMGTLNGDGIVAFYFKQLREKDLEYFTNSGEWAVPSTWNLKSGAYKNEIGKYIKQYYLSNNNVTWNDIDNVVNGITDSYFVLDQQLSLSVQVEKSNLPVYNYEFTLDTPWSQKLYLNFGVQDRVIKLTGAAHGDELPLLFVRQDQPTQHYLSGNEKNISDKIVRMWTEFAKTGNPNYRGLGVRWKSIRNNQLSYLEIGSTLKIHKGKIRQQNVQFMKKLCEITATDYPCSFL